MNRSTSNRAYSKIWNNHCTAKSKSMSENLISSFTITRNSSFNQMSNPIILSDDEEEDETSPLPSLSKKPRTLPSPPIFVLDDDPTPQKQRLASSTPSFVPDTPMSDLSILICTARSSNTDIRVSDSHHDLTGSFVPETPVSDVSIVKCSTLSSHPEIGVSDSAEKFSGNSRFISLESEDGESHSGNVMKTWKLDEAICRDDDEDKLGWHSKTFKCMDLLGDDNHVLLSEENASMPVFLQDSINQVDNDPDKENSGMEKMCNIIEEERTSDNVEKKTATNNVTRRKRLTKEERTHLMEERKRKKEQEKFEKAVLKAEAVELKKLDKEKR